MSYLNQDEIGRLVQITVQEQLTDVRPVLFSTPPMPTVRAGLQVFPVPGAQFTSDLQRLADIERLESGHIPIQLWLEVAQNFVKDATNRRFVQELLARITSVSSGAPEIAVGPEDVPEALVHEDDTLPAGFLAMGAAQVSSIGKVLVWPFENGAPLLTNGEHAPHFGTGWLIGPSLLITNHHVLNARRRLPGLAPPAADPADLETQAARAKVEFDYLSDGEPKSTIAVQTVLAHDAELDYALLQLDNVPRRLPLTLRRDERTANRVRPTTVNILQHPGGGAMRVGLRNNLVQSLSDTEIRYYTDTLSGSSGAPVQDDQWGVVALHRSSRPVAIHNYQGKSTAVINVGTLISEILRHVGTVAPAALAKIVGSDD